MTEELRKNLIYIAIGLIIAGSSVQAKESAGKLKGFQYMPKKEMVATVRSSSTGYSGSSYSSSRSYSGGGYSYGK